MPHVAGTEPKTACDPQLAYQSPRRAVNAARLVLSALLFVLFSRACPAQVTEQVHYATSDGVSILADHYRPAVPSSTGIVLLPAENSPRSEWRPLADELARRGWNVLVPDLRGQGESGAAPVRHGRIETETDLSQLWRDALAADAFLRSEAGGSLTTVIYGGSRIGAAAAVVAASRAPHPPVALLLLSPDPDLAGVAVHPILLALDLPVLIVNGRDDPYGAETARDLYLPVRPRHLLWEIASGERGTDLLRRRGQLAIDLANWAAAESHRAAQLASPPQTAARPAGEED
jgi:pimeloyl-ACP methyl ester carboxylesterase